MKYDFLEENDIPDSVSFWQSPSWKHILLSSGQAEEVFYFGNIDTSWMLVEIRSIGLGKYGAFSLGVIRNQIGDDSPEFFEQIKGFLKKKNALFFQIEPFEEVGSLKFEFGASKAYKKFLTPYTRVLDLHLSESDLLAQMHEKGRYNIRLAEKRGVVVSSVSLDEGNLDIWMSLLAETTSRDGFSQNSRKYYQEFLFELQRKNIGGLYFAQFEGKIIAASIFVFLPSCAIYYYGASSSEKEYRKHMAPYLLQWTAILEGKRRNIPLYDFLGVAHPENPNDPLRGVTDFKEKFGGTVMELPEKILLSLSWKYGVFSMVKNFLNIFR